MPGLDPGIVVYWQCKEDGRVEPGHEECRDSLIPRVSWKKVGEARMRALTRPSGTLSHLRREREHRWLKSRTQPLFNKIPRNN